MDFKKLANLPPMTELQKLKFQAGYIKRKIDRLSNYTPPCTPGVYGTSAAEASEARFAISLLKKDLIEIEEKIKKHLANC